MPTVCAFEGVAAVPEPAVLPLGDEAGEAGEAGDGAAVVVPPSAALVELPPPPPQAHKPINNKVAAAMSILRL